MGSWTASTVPHDTARSEGQMLSMRMGVTKIWKGDLVVIKTDGYAYSAYTAGAAGDQFIGVAAETRDNTYKVEGDSTSGAAAVGDKQCRVWIEGIFDMDLAVAATIETELGLPVYVADGSVNADTPRTVTVTAPAAQPIFCGNIVELLGSVVASTKCRVRITPFTAVGA